MRQAFAGMLWSKQLYYYDVAPLAGRRPDPAGPAAGARDRPQRALAQLRRLRHHVDAGQVGVPLVRRLGPGLPLRGPGPRRPGVRQVPADPAVPGVVPAPERGAARLRVGLRRRQPAGAGLGGAGGVRHRRRHGPRLPAPDLRQAAGQLHLVGQPGGRATATTCSRAASSAWTTSGRSTARTCRSAAPSSSPTPPAGWPSTRWRWPPSRSSCGATAAGRRPTWCSSSWSTSPPSRRPWTSQGLWDDADGLFYDRLRLPERRRSSRSRSGPWSASSRCSRSACSTSR